MCLHISFDRFFCFVGKGINWLVFFLSCFLRCFVLKSYRSFSYTSVNNFSSFQKEHFWSKLGINYQFVVRFMFVFLFLIFLQQVSFYFVVNDRFSYLKVCSVHYKICVLQKFIMLSFFICLKFVC